MLRAVHLRDELRVHDLVELLPARATRHRGRERPGVGENLVYVGVSADDDLRVAVAQYVKRRPPRPFGHMPMRVRFELGAAKINVDDIAPIQSQSSRHRVRLSHSGSESEPGILPMNLGWLRGCFIRKLTTLPASMNEIDCETSGPNAARAQAASAAPCTGCGVAQPEPLLSISRRLRQAATLGHSDHYRRCAACDFLLPCIRLLEVTSSSKPTSTMTIYRDRSIQTQHARISNA